jgi:Fic family protein
VLNLMQRGPTGDFEVVAAGGEQVRAFVPWPLPPRPPLVLDDPLQAQLERATLALGRLDSIGTLLPDPRLFLYAYVRREAVVSSQIEGTQSSLSQLLVFEADEAPGVPLDDVLDVSNYVAALEHGLSRMEGGFPLCNRLLREVHARLLSRGRGADKEPGEFRRSQNWIGGTRPGNARFVPPPPQHVEPCLAELERYLNADAGTQSALIQAALAHVQFETIHPFLDGNGRVGRLLIVLLLHARGLLAQPLLYLSLFFKQHRALYYERLGAIREDGDWEAWLAFFLEGVEVTAGGAVETTGRLLRLFDEDGALIRARGERRTATLLAVHEVLKHRPVIALGALSESAGISFPTASRAIEQFMALGLVNELTGGRRNRLFAYRRYLSILNEDMEPL